ncbi:alkene reductase [Paraburkholderia caballeronis]|uniref:N-ethylmaleimide reductase n=1 Tax=Paraburkholderia caballeronis TaxID=416943 RepID=A0A1H7HZC4_9BURK|nr:alkene reductase [Paraburkholderia caballeronis]PXW29297.1 N-ethylmaleimide reductase [Paraburkholderia caballeronis]PXX04556.1 N-ethylmaleimide reductase [Paraburkholderia caballeronis]RAK05617.1 N-ethylmaleimide reductase [Paraburkholderia caballeronis]TDV18396.1 N-ethylmaleimide reductase [Paraburkholderia caballeronis]TDV20066.1 N-ethylmaleimide reductase [Paraburkholderia caballeronis]
MSKLLSAVKVGPYEFSHRVVLAPLTRMRAEQGAKPGPLMAEYYAQRTSAGGFLISEATIAAPDGNGYLGAPGLYDDSQIAGWKQVTDAVHAKGGRIFLQLYHAGRQSNSQLQPGGGQPVAPSAVLHGGVAYTEAGWVPNTPSRALTLPEIAGLVESFRTAAVRGKEAGFDGVELHAANGYLFDQFLQDGSNKRTDLYGGSFENRTRFLMEVTRAIIPVWGSERVAVRLGPSGTWGDMSDSDPEGLFTYVAGELAKLNLAYLHLIEPRVLGNVDDDSKDPNPVAAQLIRQHYNGVIIAAGGFKGDTAEAILQAGNADLVAFGRDFIANPDLPERLRLKLPLNPYDRATFFGGTDVGYTDYPFHGRNAAAA